MFPRTAALLSLLAVTLVSAPAFARDGGDKTDLKIKIELKSGIWAYEQMADTKLSVSEWRPVKLAVPYTINEKGRNELGGSTVETGRGESHFQFMAERIRIVGPDKEAWAVIVSRQDLADGEKSDWTDPSLVLLEKGKKKELSIEGRYRGTLWLMRLTLSI